MTERGFSRYIRLDGKPLPERVNLFLSWKAPFDGCQRGWGPYFFYVCDRCGHEHHNGILSVYCPNCDAVLPMMALLRDGPEVSEILPLLLRLEGVEERTIP